jgi:transcriptional regulator GlxA family with amidase domain
MPRAKKLVAFTLYPGVTPLDLVGPLTVLRPVGPGWPFRTVVVGERLEAVGTDGPLGITPAATFRDAPATAALIVPGGGAATLAALRDEALLAYVRAAAATAEVVGATGNGALVLAAAGLLAGRRAAIHWAYADLLAGLGAVPARERWMHDGRFLTAAGGSAGIDAMLYLVSRLRGRSGAALAQLATEYDPEPPFGGLDRSGADDALAEMLRAPRPQEAAAGPAGRR